MDNYVDEALQALSDGSYSDWAVEHEDIVKMSCFREALTLAIKAFKKCQGSKKYHYLITFTIDPKKHPTVSDELEATIEKYISDQATRTGLNVHEMHMVKELHKNGRPHWHCSVTTTKSIKKALFTYYQKIYGHVDLSRSKGENNQDSLDYMSKCGTPTKLK